MRAAPRVSLLLALLLLGEQDAFTAIIENRAYSPSSGLLIELDPFGLDTEVVAPPAEKADAVVIGEALKLLPTLGCAGRAVADHFGDSPPWIRFGDVDAVSPDGSKARGQVFAPAPGASHLSIVIDKSRPYLRDPLNAAKIIAHEGIHDLQYHQGLIRIENGAIASSVDIHDPRLAETTLAGCRLSGTDWRGLLREADLKLKTAADDKGLAEASARLKEALPKIQSPSLKACVERRLELLSAEKEESDDRPSDALDHAERLGQGNAASDCERDVEAGALFLAGRLSLEEEQEQHAQKLLLAAADKAVDVDLKARAYLQLAQVNISLKGYSSASAAQLIERAQATAQDPAVKAEVLATRAAVAEDAGRLEDEKRFVEAARTFCGRSTCSRVLLRWLDDVGERLSGKFDGKPRAFEKPGLLQDPFATR